MVNHKKHEPNNNFSYSTISLGYHILVQFEPRSFVPVLQVPQTSMKKVSYAMSSSWYADGVGFRAVTNSGEWVGRATNYNEDVFQRPALW